MRLFFIILLFNQVTLAFAQYYPTDSIIDTDISDFKIFKDTLFYSTQNGHLHKFDLKSKEIVSTTTTPNAITGIFVDKVKYYFSTGNILSIFDKRSLDEIRLIDTKEIFSFVINENQLYYGGKSGILYKYDMSKQTTTKILSTKSENNTYWITSIKIIPQNDWLVVCAGDIFIYSLNSNKLLSRIKDETKSYFTCNDFNSNLLVSNYNKNHIISISKDFLVDTIYNNFSYLLEPYDKNNILLSPQNKTIIYNIHDNEIIEKISNQIAISSCYYNKTLLINYGNKIIFYKKQINPFHSPIILDNINFKVGELGFIDSIATYKEINELVDLYSKHKDDVFLIKIYGHTDGHNEKLFNLSIQRASKIKLLLQKLGMSDNLIYIKGFGGINPISKTNSDRWKNRRVEMKFISIKDIIENINSKNIDTNLIDKRVTILNSNDRIAIKRKNILVEKIKTDDDINYFRIPVWVVNSYKSINYTDTVKGNIITRRKTNIRISPVVNKESILFKTSANQIYKLEETLIDSKGNKWFKFYLLGYYENKN